jgi:hypothetical protein
MHDGTEKGRTFKWIKAKIKVIEKMTKDLEWVRRRRRYIPLGALGQNKTRGAGCI